MIFYDYLLNIDISIYQNEAKERGLLEASVIRLEDVKKLLSLLHAKKDKFGIYEDNLSYWFDQ